MTKENLKKELVSLIALGRNIYLLALSEGHTALSDELKKLATKARKDIPDFKSKYHSWYASAYRSVRSLAPERLDEFEQLYAGKKNSKELNLLTAGITHFLQGLTVVRYGERENFLGKFINAAALSVSRRLTHTPRWTAPACKAGLWCCHQPNKCASDRLRCRCGM